MPEIGSTTLAFEWVMLALRLAFIGLIYLFLYRVARVALQELVAIGRADQIQTRQTRRAAQAALVVQHPAESSLERGDRLPLSGYTTIGRAGDNTVVLDDGFTSSRHAEMARDAEGWHVTDLDSTNGTFVNDRQVHDSAPVEPGDAIRFGNVVVHFDG